MDDVEQAAAAHAPGPSGGLAPTAGSAPDDCPAVAVRVAPFRRMALAGTVAAALGVAAAGLGLRDFEGFAAQGGGEVWPVTGLVAAVVMLGVCAVQVILWRQADAVWRGRRAADLATVRTVSRALHVFSYVVVLVALLAGVRGSAAAAWTTSAAAWLTGAMALVVVAQVLGGVQYVRTGGAPGTIPTHLRRFSAWTAEQRRGED